MKRLKFILKKTKRKKTSPFVSKNKNWSKSILWNNGNDFDLTPIECMKQWKCFSADPSKRPRLRFFRLRFCLQIPDSYNIKIDNIKIDNKWRHVKTWLCRCNAVFKFFNHKVCRNLRKLNISILEWSHRSLYY